ncbi:DUF4862 family protein [Microbacterium sp. ASV81]|uniref:DUF4862 family protein n=1 Tax=Microbacterium capsulatum TaxID=3041921 RepID=A0ABU0XDB8_9MICO|nr:DUF4862 family protein [Microbacterium sp. ASV81]MDQ4213107.1 DUF4862 family protein [Microbacterium sp. ASV81]
MSLIVGAYAASAAHARWNPAAEQEFFEGLETLPDVRGLELPWIGSAHPHDDDWLYSHFPRRFDAVLTSVPGVMVRLRDEPRFGLASTDHGGRAAAVREALAMRDAVHRLNDACGRAAVIGIELVSAPTAGPSAIGSADALRSSLLELVEAGGWDEALLLIEHCDAAVADHPAEKGFLSVEDELTALADLPMSVGMSVNWGRSAIELRDPDSVAAQIARVAASDRLCSLMLSGTSAEVTAFGSDWADAHHPFAPIAGSSDAKAFPLGEPTSLLTLDRLRAALTAAGPTRWKGFKFGWADSVAPVARRIDMISAAAELIAAEMALSVHRA